MQGPSPSHLVNSARIWLTFRLGQILVTNTLCPQGGELCKVLIMLDITLKLEPVEGIPTPQLRRRQFLQFLRIPRKKLSDRFMKSSHRAEVRRYTGMMHRS
jgi:hypothetical protein